MEGWETGSHSVSFAQSEGAGCELAALQSLVLTSELQRLFKTFQLENKGISERGFGLGGFSIFVTYPQSHKVLNVFINLCSTVLKVATAAASYTHP